jgi:type IV pilus assembly protein PilQ
MMKFQIPNSKFQILFLILFSVFCLLSSGTFAQEPEAEELTGSENVTLDFKDADIRSVLKVIAYKSGINIVATPEVMGTITIRLQDVPWKKALDVILKTHGYGYEQVGNIITVAPIDTLTEQKKKEVELAQVQPTVTEVFKLKYLDAQDAKKALKPQLSPRGKITVLEMTGQAGWEFGTTELAKRKRIAEKKMGRSKTLIISDIPPVLDRIKEVVEKIDIKPQQILIETRLMEVNRDKLRDIGFDWATGSTGVSDGIGHTPIDKSDGKIVATVGAHAIGTSGITPSIFGPKASGLTPTAGGLEFIYRKLSGTQFEAILYALEEDVDTNTLSAPSIMALNNQEATILVGTKYPILKSEESTQSAYTVSKSLDYYQDIGIQLNVVPQISGEDHINMIIHPAVTSTTSGVGDTETVYYPIIETREAETRILMKNGETVVIGGLLKDIRSKSTVGIPILSKIPILGLFFRRDTVDTAKIDLLIFLTAHIVKEDEFSPEEINKLEESLGRAN